MEVFSFHFCIFIKRFSDAAFQTVDAKPSGGRDGNHVSEGHVVFWYHVSRQHITELCREDKKPTINVETLTKQKASMCYCPVNMLLATQMVVVLYMYAVPFSVIHICKCFIAAI